MKEHYVALDDVIATLKMKNKKHPGGILEHGRNRLIYVYWRI